MFAWAASNPNCRYTSTMCGIAGFLGEDQKRIDQMTEALVHRGPDGNATYVGKQISFGHARLAILDPSPQSNQPMWNAEKTCVIVFNGEIYNFRGLNQSENLGCTTTGDTEVLLRMYEKYGIDFVKKLRGMYAFALFDTKTQTLHLARDPHGIKPLYIATIEGKLHFASEMRALLKAFKTKPGINFRSLSAFLELQYVPGNETMCEGITSLPPGTIVSVKDGTETRRTFTQDTPTVAPMQRDAFMKDFPYVMQRVVEDHMVADRPIGIFLSGGMDSSIVLHHMAKASKAPVKTFTVRFDATEQEDAERFNRDADLAKLTARHYQTEHEELHLTAENYRAMYRDTARALDLPNADSVSVAQYALSRIAKKKVDVVLSGAGGDELFGGYPRYRIARILKLMQVIPAPIRALAATLFGKPNDVLRMAPGAPLAERLLARPVNEVKEIVKGEWFLPRVVTELFEERFADVSDFDSVRQFMEVDRHLWLVDESLKLCDAVTMASGLECRVPFIDPHVIAWSHATPTNLHVTPKRTKALLKDTYRSILPEHLFTLKKASFYPPLAKWLRRECAPLVEEALHGKRINEFFDTAVLRKKFEDHKAKKQYNLHQLSNIIQLHHWFETVYDG
jgi:asparagine synthase (glutamine-hydrolysing)